VTFRSFIAVSRLELHKSEAGSGPATDRFAYADDDCFARISFFTSIIARGRVPNSLRNSASVPIHKDRNINHTDSANFRGISLSPVFGKVKVAFFVFERHVDVSMSSELKFGMKARDTTDYCMLCIIIDVHKEQGTCIESTIVLN